MPSHFPVRRKKKAAAAAAAVRATGKGTPVTPKRPAAGVAQKMRSSLIARVLAVEDKKSVGESSGASSPALTTSGKGKTGKLASPASKKKGKGKAVVAEAPQRLINEEQVIPFTFAQWNQ